MTIDYDLFDKDFPTLSRQADEDINNCHGRELVEEIKRLRSLVKDAYEEGWNEGHWSNEDMVWIEAWETSISKEELEK